PNLTLVGIDQSAMRVASTMPSAHFEAAKIGKTFEEAARTKSDVVAGWWDANSMRRKMRRRARHLIGYGASPVVVRPDVKRQIPCWQVLSPRNVFPAPMLDPDEMCPEDCMFRYERTWSWLRDAYEEQFVRIYKGENFRRGDARVQLVEHWDAEWCTLLAVGAPRGQYDTGVSEWGHSRFEVLERTANRAGVCPIVIPGRISLDDVSTGVMDQNVGIHERQARMMAYEELAIQRSIFTETWLESEQNGNPQILTVADGKEGVIGKVSGGRLREIRPDPSLAALQAVDRGERAQRIQGGVPAEFGGESPTNVRTGKRGDSVLSAVVDHPTQEHQELLAESLHHENRVAIAWDKALFNRSKPVFVSWKNARGAKTYEPRKLWDSDDHQVRYSHPGADANGLVIGGGQRVGLGSMSIRSFQEIDPLIDNPEQEHDRVIKEKIEEGIVAEFLQPGSFALAFKAEVMELVATDKLELAEAILAVEKKAKELQAANVDPVDPGDPAAQPGIQTGVGTEAASVPPADSSLEGLLSQLGGQTRLAGALRLGQRAAPQEAMFNAAAGAA
ncbi:MAG TPA: hypothetical protein VMZ71_02040, partial [Gemmataceae bacterium]|nr:hypothetical protein [Gemmataceae bacterium]